MQVILKPFCLKLGAYSFAQFLYCNQKNLWLAPFLQVKVFPTMQLTLSIAIMQVTFVAIMKVSRFRYNYAGSTFCYSYVGESFCCNYAVRCFCSTYACDSFCNEYVGDNFHCNYVGESLCWNYAGGVFCSALCTWLFHDHAPDYVDDSFK